MLLLPIPWVANAAGLGRLAVLSSLGQPFRAEIDLVSHQDELATLSSRIASPDTYKQADFQYSSALAGLRLDIKKQPNGRAYIEVTSSRPVNEPFIHLLIELSWDSTRLIRGYTALIDPPGFGPIPVTSARVAVPEAQPAPGAQSAVSRRMTARVEEKTAAYKGKETLSTLHRINILEQESTLRAKALAALLERIALLEKTVQGMQRLLDTRNRDMVVAPKPAAVEPPAQNPEAAKSEVVAAAEQEEASIDIKKEGPKTVSPTKKPVAQAEPEKPKSKIVPPPLPESSLVNTIVGERLHLAAGGIVILLGGLAFWMRRRRQLQEVTSEDILNKLLTRDPGRDDVQIKLLEIYAARKDKAAFHSAAGKFNKLTGDQGEAWLKVAAMGYALDPGNPLYEAGKYAASASAAAATNEVESPSALKPLL